MCSRGARRSSPARCSVAWGSRGPAPRHHGRATGDRERIDVYGTFATVIGLLTWLSLLATSTMGGAELNAGTVETAPRRPSRPVTEPAADTGDDSPAVVSRDRRTRLALAPRRARPKHTSRSPSRRSATLLVEPLYVLTDTPPSTPRHGPLAGLALASVVLNTLVWGCSLPLLRHHRCASRSGGAAATTPAPPPTRSRRCGWRWRSGAPWRCVVGFGAEALVGLLGDDPRVVEQGTTYLRVSAVGLPFHFVAIAAIGYLYGLPDTTRPFVIALSANVVNLVVELVLVFGLDTGIAGSAWGTVVAQVLAAVAFAVVVIPVCDGTVSDG